MSHVPEETLAGVALGETDALGAAERRHLSRCARCTAELDDLRQVVATGRSGPAYPARQPRPGLLRAVQAELDADLDISPEVRDAWADPVSSTSGQETRGTRMVHRRRWVIAAVAVAVVVGVAATITYRQTEESVVATAVLAPLPDKSGSGTAEMITRDGSPELSVSIKTTPPADRFEEVWLFQTDGSGMISVGIVPPTGQAVFPVPAAAGALDGYTVVDVSLEPYDGNSAHSHNSILRGTLS